MIDALSPLIGSKTGYTSIIPAAQAAGTAKVQEEFLAIFYKELLKQAFKAPDFSLLEEEEKENNLLSSYNNELMIEQMARELIKQNILQPELFGILNK